MTPRDFHERFERLLAISQTGLTYTQNPYDVERYQEIKSLSEELLSVSLNITADQLRTEFLFEKGYPTPKVDVRAAVFNAAGEILLVREEGDGRWSLPGGWVDIGDTPSEAAEREVREESGFVVKATKLAAVIDKRSRGETSCPWHAFTLYFLCELKGGSATLSVETTGVEFFPITALPELSLGRTREEHIILCETHRTQPELPTIYD